MGRHELHPVDTFGDEVEALVLSTYTASIKGSLIWIESGGKISTRTTDPTESRFFSGGRTNVETLSCHVGNLCFVSLIMLFDGWLNRQENELRDLGLLRRRETKKGDRSRIVSRFRAIERVLGTGSLSADRLQEVVDARDAIVHHGGFPDFKGQRKVVVADEFIEEVAGAMRVAIGEDVLVRLSNEIKCHAKAWFAEMRQRIRSGRKGAPRAASPRNS